MLTLLTSCNRPDLLDQTLKSLLHNQEHKISLAIMEDGLSAAEFAESEIARICHKYKNNMMFAQVTEKVGQHGAIEQFLKHGTKQKYYLHLEDDWEFKNNYDWIHRSIKIMETDPNVIKVLAREGSPHPCDHKFKSGKKKYGYIHPWESPDNILWHGFSWNPGVTRLDLLKKFAPFPKWEQELAKNIFDSGYKVVELADPVYSHIGDGRSTHD